MVTTASFLQYIKENVAEKIPAKLVHCLYGDIIRCRVHTIACLLVGTCCKVEHSFVVIVERVNAC